MIDKESRNLLVDPWLPVRLAGRSVIKISVNEIGRRDVVDFEVPRADFRGALYQLLIGLLQTAFAPAGRREWKQYWKASPAPDELAAAFEPYVQAFNINSEVGEPAFMQDLTLSVGEEKEIAAMFVEAPGGKTIRDNLDHFIKRDGIEQLSPWNAALALFTLQINAPSGGVGHRVSLRGGGPLTTLAMPPENGCYDTLWHRLWLNVLTEEELTRLPGNRENNAIDAVFPWMATTRTSEKKGMETFPDHAHPLQAYWSMPRRMRLAISGEAGICGLTGEASDHLVRTFTTKNYGINYAGSWIHPLTPYAIEDGKEPLSIKAQPGGLGYRHWLGLVVAGRQGKIVRTPATIVQCYESRREWIGDADFQPRLWAFGFDMDNMKARCWYEAEMPVFNLELEQRDDVAEYVQKMIEAATDVLKTLKAALKKAWFKRPADIKGDMSFVDNNFWLGTEIEFYFLLGTMVKSLDDEGAIDKLLDRWQWVLKDRARTLFDQYVLSNFNEDGDLKRVVDARDGKRGLQHYLNGSKALKALKALIA